MNATSKMRTCSRQSGESGQFQPIKSSSLAKIATTGLFYVALLLALLTNQRTAGAQQAGQDDDGAYAMGNQGRMVRGTITAVSADRLTVKTEAGESFQVIVTTNTRLMKDRQPVKFADIHGGDGIGAMGVIDPTAKTVHAAVAFVVDAAQVRKMKEDMGKTYISGKVVAIDDLELTIHRQDGVTQKIAVDEGTSFKKGGRRAGAAMRGDGSGDGLGPGGGAGTGGPGTGGSGGPSLAGGESITLADIKVGDVVIGPGGIKGGTFVPTQLTVLDAATMGRRRRSEGSDAAAAAPAGTNTH